MQIRKNPAWVPQSTPGSWVSSLPCCWVFKSETYCASIFLLTEEHVTATEVSWGSQTSCVCHCFAQFKRQGRVMVSSGSW